MNTRKKMKERARHTVFRHYGILLTVCLIAIILGTDFGGSFDFFKIPGETDKADKLSKYELAESEFGVDRGDVWNIAYSIMEGSIANEEKAAGKLENQAIEKSKAETNAILGRSNGVLAKLVNGMSSGMFFVKAVKAFHGLGISKNAAALIAASLVTLVYAAVWFLFINIYEAIAARIFLECRTYEKVGIQRLFFVMRSGKWLGVCKTLFMKFLFHWLWSLTIIGGVIKHYSYFLVPYIAAENPEAKWKDCIALSRRMMNGHKWECFVMELSFLLWDIAGILTLGLSDLMYTNMYKSAFFAEFYAGMRVTAKEKEIPGNELLCDEYLFEKAPRDARNRAYEDVLEMKKQPQGKAVQSGIRGFIEKNFGITMYNRKDEEKFWKQQKRALVIEAADNAMEARTYPDRLSPNPVHRQSNHFERLHYMRHYSIGSLILMFFAFSLIGWIWEVGFHLYENGFFVNRGILHGPWIPIYGFGGLLILTLLYRLRKSPAKEFAVSVLLCGILEYFTSYFMELAYNGTKWWDYSGYFLNLDGRICAEGLIVFGLGGFLIVYLLAPALDNLFRRMKPGIMILLCALLLSAFLWDLSYSIKYPNEGMGITFPSDDLSQSPYSQGHPQDYSAQ